MIYYLFGVCVVLCGFIGSAQNAAVADDYKLVLVHGIFRHGARSTYGFYPNDPHRNNTFYPIGLGGLTNEGKLQEYHLGQNLRKEYEHFLDEIYSEDLMEIRSTGTERTKMSAQLVLAGLFPPVAEQVWNTELPWQPIPVYFRNEEDEDLLHPKNCPHKLKIESELTKLEKIQELYMKPYQKLYDYINSHSGLNVTTVQELIEFYFIISTEEEMNLKLPEWLKSVYPEPIISTSALTYHFMNYNEDVRKINMGYLLQKMMTDTQAKIHGDKQFKNKKMFLYSAHESTIGFFMDGLNILHNHIPPYASIVLLEIWENKAGRYFVKLRYKEGSRHNIEDVQHPTCATLCPLEKFIKINDAVLPKISIKEACGTQ